MDILDWRPLVLNMCARYAWAIRENNLSFDDAIQAGMLGLVIADKDYVGEVAEKWSFMSIALMRIRNEIQTLLFSDVKSSTFRNKEAPISPEMVITLSGADNDIMISNYDVEEFCDKLPLEDREKDFFRDIVEYGSLAAGKIYRDKTGMSRAGMGLRRKQVVNAAACLYSEVTNAT